MDVLPTAELSDAEAGLIPVEEQARQHRVTRFGVAATIAAFFLGVAAVHAFPSKSIAVNSMDAIQTKDTEDNPPTVDPVQKAFSGFGGLFGDMAKQKGKEGDDATSQALSAFGDLFDSVSNQDANDANDGTSQVLSKFGTLFKTLGKNAGDDGAMGDVGDVLEDVSKEVKNAKDDDAAEEALNSVKDKLMEIAKKHQGDNDDENQE